MLILPFVRASLNGANQRAVVSQLTIHDRQRFQDRTVRQDEVQRLVFGDLQERLVSGVVEVQRGAAYDPTHLLQMTRDNKQVTAYRYGSRAGEPDYIPPGAALPE